MIWSVRVIDGNLSRSEPDHTWLGALRSLRQDVLDQTNNGRLSPKEATEALRRIVDLTEGMELKTITLQAGRRRYLVDRS